MNRSPICAPSGFYKTGSSCDAEWPSSAPVPRCYCPGGRPVSREKSQLLPVLEQIRDRLPQAGVRFHFPLLELGFEPGMQFVHDRLAMLVVGNGGAPPVTCLVPAPPHRSRKPLAESPARTGTVRVGGGEKG